MVIRSSMLSGEYTFLLKNGVSHEALNSRFSVFDVIFFVSGLKPFNSSTLLAKRIKEVAEIKPINTDARINIKCLFE